MGAALLQPDHIGHRHQRLGNYAISDFPTSRKSVTLVMPGGDQLGSRFYNKKYRYTFDGVGYTRGGRYLLVDGNSVGADEFEDPRDQPAPDEDEPTPELERSQVVTPVSAENAQVEAIAEAEAEAEAEPDTREPSQGSLVASAWASHQGARPARPWTNVDKTSCFVRNETGVDVTLCPTPQSRAVASCPPKSTPLSDKAHRVMVCGRDEGAFFFSSIADATPEGESLAMRQRARTAAPSTPAAWPAGDDFAAQERFLDELVPTRMVIELDRPFRLLPVRVDEPHVVADGQDLPVGAWKEREWPADAELVARVVVGDRPVALSAFVDALGDELYVYRGNAGQTTINALLRISSSALQSKHTANDIGHGVFGGRSLYWLGDGEADFAGPILANGRPASGRAKQEVLDRFAKALALPDSLPLDWTLDDTIVIAALVGSEPGWTSWNAREQMYSSKRESNKQWSKPEPMAHVVDDDTGESDYTRAAAATVAKLLEKAPATIRFRIAGPWLGVLYPSDYDSRVEFEPPRGGQLDLQRLAHVRDHHQELTVRRRGDADVQRRHRRATKRFEWARRWLEGNAKGSAPPTKRARRSAKPTRADTPKPPRAKRTPKPRATAAPKPARMDRAKLRALADSMESKANAELSADRQENTRRRASMAAGIRDRARRQLVLARTLRRIAEVGSGSYQHVSRVANRADLEALEQELMRAGVDRRKAANVFEYWKLAEPELADVEHASFRSLRSDRAGIGALIDAVAGQATLADPIRVLRAAASRLGDEFGPLRREEVAAARELLGVIRKGKQDRVPRPVEALTESLRELDRLGRLGIVDTNTLRAALREYLSCCRSHERKATADPIAAKKRELAFAKIPGFFPTPLPVIEQMLEEAELEPGMRVLEPSAGDGAIAVVVRERHPEVELDVVERQAPLRSLLEAQGLPPVAHDFCAFTPSRLYDRILMNPPFEVKQDIRHIDHALDVLAPGGRLVAVASAGLSFREDAPTKALRERIEGLGGRIQPLPAGSFEASGSGVSTVLVTVDAPDKSTHEPAIPRSEAMTECSSADPSACRTKPKKTRQPRTKKKPATAAAQEPASKRKPASKKPSSKKPASKKPAPKKASSKKPTSKKASGKKTPASKKPASKKPSSKKKPSWRYTFHRGDRYRFREVDGTFVVERSHPSKGWTEASASAAKSIHAHSDSLCALAARILPTCGNTKGKPKRAKPKPSEAQKHAMRKFLGL